jgi:hypothetical protein
VEVVAGVEVVADEAAMITFLAETILTFIIITIITTTTTTTILENHDLIKVAEEEAAAVVVEEEVDRAVVEEVVAAAAAAEKIGGKWPRNLRGFHPQKVQVRSLLSCRWNETHKNLNNNFFVLASLTISLLILF